MKDQLILIVEDNATTRKMIRVVLTAENYSVAEAEDGQSALEKAAELGPRLILLDCRLPDLTGFEVARRLRARDPRTPIIALTGWAQMEDSEMLAAGFSDVLIKPVEPAKLIEVIMHHLDLPPPKTEDITRRILVADDDPAQRRLAELSLSTAGFTVHTVASGPELLVVARETPPDVIVCDVLMPRMDGFTVARTVRRDSRLDRVPIVLISSHYLDEDDARFALRCGANRFVPRTGGFDQIVRAVIDVLDAPVPPLTADDELEGEHFRRVGHQLDRQVSINADLNRQTVMQATALSVLSGISDALPRQLDPEGALGETLAQCLDAAGLSVGAILLQTQGGGFSLRTHVGSMTGEVWSAHTNVLAAAMTRDHLLLPSSEGGRDGDELLRQIRVASALLVPITAREEPLGVLVLASNHPDFLSGDRAAFVRAARSVSMQLGQAIVLSRTFIRLAAAEQRYSVLLDNARDAISVLNRHGVVLEANRRWQELLQVPRERLVGHHINEFVPTHVDQSAVATFPDVSSAFQTVVVRRTDGTTANVELSTTIVDVGAEQLVLAIGRDVTERVRLEEQFRQAQKMEAIGRLAGGLAHDFNNLLSVIMSYADLSLDELHTGDPIREDIQEIERAAKRAATLTRQLLLFSRQQVLEPRNIDLNEILTEMDRMVRRLVGEDVELVALPAETLGRVRADPGSIEQVIMNLVVNARDAMPTGGTLTLGTANVVIDDKFTREHLGARPGPHVMLSVADTGHGMDEATKARVFEPFFTTKEKGKGTGLGLSTVFGIVQQSEGHLWLETAVNQGTTFRIYFPEVHGSLSAAKIDKPARAARGSETILVVEDDDQVRAVACGILRRNGYQVLEARNAGEALHLSNQHRGPCHLLLSDVVMPKMSGPELAVRLRLERPELRVLLMSGYTDDTALRHQVFVSELAFLQKPITVDGILRKVREVLETPRIGL